MVQNLCNDLLIKWLQLGSSNFNRIFLILNIKGKLQVKSLKCFKYKIATGWKLTFLQVTNGYQAGGISPKRVPSSFKFKRFAYKSFDFVSIQSRAAQPRSLPGSRTLRQLGQGSREGLATSRSPGAIMQGNSTPSKQTWKNTIFLTQTRFEPKYIQQ